MALWVADEVGRPDRAHAWVFVRAAGAEPRVPQLDTAVVLDWGSGVIPRRLAVGREEQPVGGFDRGLALTGLRDVRRRRQQPEEGREAT